MRTMPAKLNTAATAPHPSNVLPDAEEVKRVALGPDAYSHRVAGDVRLYLSAGYALLMQVGHPTVGAGVRDHSTFEQDPWGRLLRTMDYLYLFSHSGEGSADVGRRLREVHKSIKGTNPDGSKYHALEPEAYAWVHATLIEAVIRSYRRFVGPLSGAQAERFYGEWMPMGRMLGIRPGGLPDDWDGFRDYFDTMVHDRLERNETVDRVVRTMNYPQPPPIPFLKPLWPALRLPPRRALKVVTTGLLPRELRARFGLRWTRPMQLELRALGAASRALTPLIPPDKLDIAERHLRWRAEEIAAGPLGPGAGEAATTATGAA